LCINLVIETNLHYDVRSEKHQKKGDCFDDLGAQGKIILNGCERNRMGGRGLRPAKIP